MPGRDNEKFGSRSREPNYFDSKQNYLRIMEASALGPQREGMPDYDLDEVFNDSDTVFVPYGEREFVWPLLTPVDNNSEYPSHFFPIYRSGGDYHYLALPSIEVMDRSPSFTSAALEQIEIALAQDIRLVFEESPGRYLREYLVKQGLDKEAFRTDYFRDGRNHKKAAVIHFDGLTDIRHFSNPNSEVSSLREAYALLGNKRNEVARGTLLLSPDGLDMFIPEAQKSVIARLWEIYVEQFTQLVHQHPSRQAQTYEELAKMVSDPDTITIAHFVEGDIVSFGMFVGNIEACDWLNPKFYLERYGMDNVLYFPGVVTDNKKQGNKYTFNLINLVAQLLSKGGRNKHIVFQCTNVSEDYIPKIVEQAALASGIGEVHMQESWRYDYMAIQKSGKHTQ